jgi:tRNA (guanine37-N1)-methyltransferase
VLIDVVTIFPQMFEGFLAEGIIRIAREKGLVTVNVHNLRDHTLDKHRKVDDRPYGGGPGMVLSPEPVFRAVEALRQGAAKDSLLVLLSPQGERLDQKLARALSAEKGLVILCGHYEGFDERIVEGLAPREISIGDFVLSGGEVPAMVLVDCLARLVPGVVGNEKSVEEDSFSQDTLDFPHYTRPEDFRGMKVPDVLVSGDHKKIAEWRRKQALERTAKRRGEMLGRGGPGHDGSA